MPEIYQERIFNLSVNCAKEAAKRNVKLFVELSTAEVYDSNQVNRKGSYYKSEYFTYCGRGATPFRKLPPRHQRLIPGLSLPSTNIKPKRN